MSRLEALVTACQQIAKKNPTAKLARYERHRFRPNVRHSNTLIWFHRSIKKKKRKRRIWQRGENIPPPCSYWDTVPSQCTLSVTTTLDHIFPTLDNVGLTLVIHWLHLHSHRGRAIKQAKPRNADDHSPWMVLKYSWPNWPSPEDSLVSLIKPTLWAVTNVSQVCDDVTSVKVQYEAAMRQHFIYFYFSLCT